uniref:Uncharacterized protein n=1 Tax=Mesocestoides corti TaxID=53468 RepID=A0A5K3G0V6_MESCO
MIVINGRSLNSGEDLSRKCQTHNTNAAHTEQMLLENEQLAPGIVRQEYTPYEAFKEVICNRIDSIFNNISKINLSKRNGRSFVDCCGSSGSVCCLGSLTTWYASAIWWINIPTTSSPPSSTLSTSTSRRPSFEA